MKNEAKITPRERIKFWFFALLFVGAIIFPIFIPKPSSFIVKAIGIGLCPVSVIGMVINAKGAGLFLINLAGTLLNAGGDKRPTIKKITKSSSKRFPFRSR